MSAIYMIFFSLNIFNMPYVIHTHTHTTWTSESTPQNFFFSLCIFVSNFRDLASENCDFPGKSFWDFLILEKISCRRCPSTKACYSIIIHSKQLIIIINHLGFILFFFIFLFPFFHSPILIINANVQH